MLGRSRREPVSTVQARTDAAVTMTRRVRSRVGTQENWQILDDPVKSNSERGQETSHFRILVIACPVSFSRLGPDAPVPGCRCAPSDGKWMPGPTATGESRGRRPS